ncbi:hypothetical protein FL966_12190 [Caproiciproducens galactitolivorans]|uniref:Uncharacterized protein n=1 Tax=Caproiciproducens galactitolivorans TaxID=642589 RepID=A0A4Z0YDJ7_9FIRM|nr:hypothetical protein [Caproiciproducens galactitolivorans]QEY35761.1 hypothetical protein FL966_12190 [Caproiciproducens galactitolivorans]TGJ77495.1 hypothetical protein CAGA_08670 [Caproiciproducens galactitolivorans]
MKKITGKVVSLVLALALVVSSFSANFAFAATKSMAGVVTDTAEDDIYLCNGGTGDREIDLNDFLAANGSGFNMETKNHKDVDNVKVSSISHISGDRLVSLKLRNNDDDAYLRLKSSTKTGTEVISVLFKADYTDDDGNEYTVKASQKLTVHVYDKDQLVLGKKDSNGVGKGVDELDDIPMTAGATVEIGAFVAQPESEDSCYAVLTPAHKIFLSKDKKDYKDSGFTLEVTSGSSDIHFLTEATVNGKKVFQDQFDDAHMRAKDVAQDVNGVLYAVVGKLNSQNQITGDASTGNITLTAKKLVQDGATYKASTDSDEKYTLKAKIAKKIDIEALKSYNSTDSSDARYLFKKTVNNAGKASDINYTIRKDGKSILDGFTQFDGNDVNLTDKEIKFPTDTDTVTVNEDVNIKKISGKMNKLTIGDCNVGEVDIDNGEVTIDEGKVGDVTIGDDDSTKAKLTITNGAKVGNIDTTDANDNEESINIDGATVGNIKTDGDVEIETNDDDHTVTVGEIAAAGKVTVNADEAKVSISALKAADEDAEFTLYNTDNMELKVGKIDFDYYDDVKLNLGNEDDEDDIFTGTIPAPINAADGSIETKNEDTNVTVTGKVDVDTISVDSDSTITFKDDVKAGTVDGDGTMVVVPGKLYVKESASSTKLKLDGNFAAGTVAFKADAGNVDVDDFDCYGFTLEKSTASNVDTFKVKSVSFAGIQINKTSANIAKGYSETFTATAYPNGTTIPAGYTVKWDLDGGSSDVFSMTTNGNTATVKVNSIDSTFASQNHATLTATLYDADGYEVEDYSAAKCEITAIAVPEAKIDTTNDFSLAQGASYQFKVTSTTAPSFTVGTPGAFNVALASKNGNDYFYKITAVGKVGSSAGIYLNGAKVCVVTIKAPAFTCDTTKDVTVKGSYQVKVTATTTPTFSVGTAGVFKASFVKKVGNDYFYKLTSVGKVGAKSGVYVNGVKVFVATVG